MYAVQVRLMIGQGTRVATEKSMRTFLFFAIRFPNLSSFLFSFPLLFFSSFLCIVTARLFGSRSFGLGGVALSRQCGKMNFLKAKILRFFRNLEASTVLPTHGGLLIFIPHIVCVPMYSNVLNLLICFDIRRCEGRSKSVWLQLRINTLLQSKGYVVICEHRHSEINGLFMKHNIINMFTFINCTSTGLIYLRFALYLRFMLRLLYNSPFALYDIDDWIVFR